MERQDLILKVVKTAIVAGKEMLDIYNKNDFEVRFKTDNSPLTEADKVSHQYISEQLKDSYPILSEEGIHSDYSIRSKWDYFWLIDPLDGTKEFIKRNGEFTVNIALIHHQEPIAGVIYVPVIGELYFGDIDFGAYKAMISVLDPEISSMEELMSKAEKLPNAKDKDHFMVVGSRSHMNSETQEFIETLKNRFDKVEVLSRGSSLKLCMVAEGNADIYPRFAPTMEWDTAAGHAIAVAAGCRVVQADGSKMVYNKQNLLNPWFIVKGQNYRD